MHGPTYFFLHTLKLVNYAGNELPVDFWGHGFEPKECQTPTFLKHTRHSSRTLLDGEWDGVWQI